MMLFTAGVFVCLLAATQLMRGDFVFNNASYRQTTFAAGGIGVGIVFMLLAFLPSGDWVYKHITTRHPLKLKKAQRQRSHKK